MKRRIFGIGTLLACVILLPVIYGCGSNNRSAGADSVNEDVAPVDTETAGDIDEITEEPPVEEDVVSQPVDVEALLDEDTMGFSDGYVFDLSEVKIEEHQGFYFKIDGSESVIETVVTSDMDASTAAQTMADNLKATSGEAPVVDYHSEGIYITGLYEKQIMLCFLADGANGTYIMSMRTVDTENSIDIFNSVISDFLAGGATDASVRTEYGQPVESGNVEGTENEELTPNEGTYYNIPEGYKCTYTCEFFDIFENDDYEYQFNFTEDDDLTAFANGKSDTYIDQKITKIAEVNSANGKVVIGERVDDSGYYRYHAVNADGTVNIYLTTNFGEQIDKSTCEKLFKDVLK